MLKKILFFLLFLLVAGFIVLSFIKIPAPSQMMTKEIPIKAA